MEQQNVRKVNWVVVKWVVIVGAIVLAYVIAGFNLGFEKATLAAIAVFALYSLVRDAWLKKRLSIILIALLGAIYFMAAWIKIDNVTLTPYDTLYFVAMAVIALLIGFGWWYLGVSELWQIFAFMAVLDFALTGHMWFFTAILGRWLPNAPYLLHQ